MTKTIESFVLTLKWCASFLVSNVGTQSIPAFSVCGIAELERSIGLRRIDLQDLILNLKPGDPDILHESLVDRKKIIFPPLHIKLSLMKQFVKTLPIDSDCFKYITLALPGLSIEKIKTGVFDSPQIRQLIKDEHFTGTMSDLEKNAWLSFKDVVKNFLGNTRASNYTEIVQKLLESYKALGCNMRIKLHCLHCHLSGRSWCCEQGERFHQDLKIMEERYQGILDVHMMADYFWSIKRDSQVEHSRKSYKRNFLP